MTPMTHALERLSSSHSSIVAAVEDGGFYSSTRRLWSAVYYKVFECTEHSAIEIHRQLCQVYGHTRLGSQHISCRSSAGRCLIISHPIARTSRPEISIFSYNSSNSSPVSVSVSRMTNFVDLNELIVNHTHTYIMCGKQREVTVTIYP